MMKRIMDRPAARVRNVVISASQFVFGREGHCQHCRSFVRRAVEEKFAALSGDLSRCETTNKWPICPASNGREVPIRRVRIRKVLDVSAIGQGNRERFVMSSSNHHVEVFASWIHMAKRHVGESIGVSLTGSCGTESAGRAYRLLLIPGRRGVRLSSLSWEATLSNFIRAVIMGRPVLTIALPASNDCS